MASKQVYELKYLKIRFDAILIMAPKNSRYFRFRFVLDGNVRQQREYQRMSMEIKTGHNLLHRSFHNIRIPPTVIIIWRRAISTNCSILKVAMLMVGLLVIIVLVVIVVAANIVIMMMVHIVFDRWRRCRRCPRQMIFYWIIIYRITTTNIPIPILGIPCFFFLKWGWVETEKCKLQLVWWKWLNSYKYRSIWRLNDSHFDDNATDETQTPSATLFSGGLKKVTISIFILKYNRTLTSF